jgi:hypothetical protein
MLILSVLTLSLFNLRAIKLKQPLPLFIKDLFDIIVFLKSKLPIGVNSLLTAFLNISINILILSIFLTTSYYLSEDSLTKYVNIPLEAYL